MVMIQYRTLVFVLGFLFSISLQGQRDSIVVLQEVILTDVKLSQFSKGIKVKRLNDSVIRQNNASLTAALLYNSSIYFRENGAGMVSSASFRGTSAQQTAVVWNGININSQLNGQTDFNTILTQNYDHIVIRSGGGSTQYGSGAIGGSIHLQNVLDFNPHYRHEVLVRYGSLDSRNINYNSSYSNEKIALEFGANYSASDNDYKYLNTDRRNENGAFEHLNFNANGGYIVGENQLIKVFHNTFIGDRNFSGTLTAPSNDNYKDLNSRSLLEWSSFNDRSVVRLKGAYIYERFRYFPNKETSDFSFGRSANALLNFDYKYNLRKITLNGIAELSNIQASGSAIEKTSRNTAAGTFLLAHKVSEKFQYGLNLRKEIVQDYKSPFVYAVDAKYQITPSYALRFGGSKNFRIPTFNDLYWNGAGATGNRNVTPETSLQAEFGQTYARKGFEIGVTAYYIASDDLIQWRPDLSGIWSPMNLNKTNQYGLEVAIAAEKKWQEHLLKWESSYAHTQSVNAETNRQLIYVPKNKVTTNFVYQYQKWGWYYQLLFNDMVYTTTDNSASLPSYSVSNTGINYRLFGKAKVAHIVGLRIQNLFNTNYQNVAFRPMPGRTIQFQLNSKF